MAHLRDGNLSFGESLMTRAGHDIKYYYQVGMIIPVIELSVDDLVYWLVAAAVPRWPTHLEMVFRADEHQNVVSDSELEKKTAALVLGMRGLGFEPMDFGFECYPDRIILQLSLFAVEEMTEYKRLSS